MLDFRNWAIVEIGPHRETTMGLVSECRIAGVGWLQVDTPREDGVFSTQYLNPSVVRRITPANEEQVRSRLGLLTDDRSSVGDDPSSNLDVDVLDEQNSFNPADPGM